MILVFGGAYQGKLDFVCEKWGISLGEVLFLTEESRSFATDKKVLYGLEQMTLGMVRRGENAEGYVKEHASELEDKIVICQDISRGLVPMDTVERAWREENGRCMNLLGARAEEVYGVFCGLESRVK